MAQSSFSQRFRWHFPYWVAILGLASWIVWGKVNDRDEVVKTISMQTIRNLETSASAMNDKIQSEISENALAYKTPQNEAYNERAKKARDIARAFKNKLYQAIIQLGPIAFAYMSMEKN